MKLLIVSDTHGMHWLLPKLPEADIFIHCGDFANSGRYAEEYIDFNEWLDKVPVPKPHRLLCAGNHDVKLDAYHAESSLKTAAHGRGLLTNGVYLQDQSITLLGKKFYFSPWTPSFCGWGFNADRGDQIRPFWEQIPDDTEILITHGPPYGILDKSVRESDERYPMFPHLGCEELAKRIKDLKYLRLHAFGHIHGGMGIWALGIDWWRSSVLRDKIRK